MEEKKEEEQEEDAAGNGGGEEEELTPSDFGVCDPWRAGRKNRIVVVDACNFCSTVF